MKQDKTISQLSSSVTEVARATSPASMFKVLLEESRCAAPRAAIFLIRRGEVHGWGSVGYGTEVAGRQREHREALTDGWLQDVCSDSAGRAMEDPGDSLDFGQEKPDSRVACALRISGRAIAVVVVERGADESPWHPQALELMLNVGRLRLELEIALRRGTREEARGTQSSATGEQATVEADETSKAPESKSADEKDASPELKAARRYAKLVATDIRLYNEEAVMLGRKNKDLIDRLGEDIERGKTTFMQRHAALGAEGTSLLHQAFVTVLAAGDESLIPPSLLE